MKVLIEVDVSELFNDSQTQEIILKRWRELFEPATVKAKSGIVYEVFNLPPQILKAENPKGEIKWLLRAPREVEADITEVLEEMDFPEYT